jgi:hypothetical protein
MCIPPGRCNRVAAAALAFLIIVGGGQAAADEVYGRVMVGGKPKANAVLLVQREGGTEGVIEVSANAEGIYRVFLEPGRYQAWLKTPGQTTTRSETKTIVSLPAPARHDLAFSEG